MSLIKNIGISTLTLAIYAANTGCATTGGNLYRSSLNTARQCLDESRARHKELQYRNKLAEEEIVKNIAAYIRGDISDEQKDNNISIVLGNQERAVQVVAAKVNECDSLISTLEKRLQR